MVTSTTVMLPKVRRRPWLKVLGLLVIFGAGLATGVGLTIVVAIHRIEYAIHHPDIVPLRLTKYLKRKLDLDDAQAGQVRSILTQRQADLGEIRLKFRPDVQHQLALLRAQVGDVLDSSQKQKWFELFDRAKDRWTPSDTDFPSTQPAE